MVSGMGWCIAQGMADARLTGEERAAARVPGWQDAPGHDAIQREWRFADFVSAWGFMSRVALLAEAHGHHPDWSNSYGTVRITLSTHDAGGVTAKDVALARAIDALP